MKKKNMTIQDKILIWMYNNSSNNYTASKDDIPNLVAEGIVCSKRSFYDAMKNLRKKGYVFYDDGRYWVTVDGEDYLFDNNLICSDVEKTEEKEEYDQLEDDDYIDSKADDSRISQLNVAYEKAMDAYKAAMDAYKVAIDIYKQCF